ncbi:DUF1643 domain-containing protein [Thiospirochaeta perfilievii]|uniref:DUF1643 domain-containing protein n=1 Tax=Thiospirochaeta perfilievii TaxID=252967 RepID=A0A5C1QFS3_9SPIO|nr:DUF1643 domain-containing protein [Thiospirochaeta perfilievii]QEN06267.1 DUF1643 domain-containing protein [Thiospirochaeta perfilievii]
MGNWIYNNTLNNKSRYILGERGKNPLVCIGVNPSTATPYKLDNTLRVVKSRALSLGYDSWIMINLYPQRATDPNKLHKNIDLKIHRENLKAISELLMGNSYDIWVAWGTLIEKRKYLKRCLFDLSKILEDNKIYSIGKISKKGHPHHPLYLRNNLPIEKFNILNYIKNI